MWLPLVIARSRGYTYHKPNIPLVPHQNTPTTKTGKTRPRHALGWCRDRVANTNPHWGANGDSFFFVAASSRGPCCDGGQPRDPGLLRHHFIGHVGERSDGPWLFREARFADRLLRDSQYKAPVTRDTAPRIRCFDERKDISVPPPVFLLRDRGAGDLRDPRERFDYFAGFAGRRRLGGRVLPETRRTRLRPRGGGARGGGGAARARAARAGARGDPRRRLVRRLVSPHERDVRRRLARGLVRPTGVDARRALGPRRGEHDGADDCRRAVTASTRPLQIWLWYSCSTN